MKANTKRILSLVLGLLLLLAMLPVTTFADETETGKVNITSSTLVGIWKTNGDPTKAYDGNTGTRWNPQSTGYESGEGIIFNLDNTYDLSQIKITVGSRYHYFDIYGSADGITYQPVVTVDASNYATYYLTDYVCTIDNLNTKNVQHLKVLITGNSSATLNAYVNFDEIEIFGAEAAVEPNATVLAGVADASVNNTWGNARASDLYKFYDGNTATRWNPNATNFTSDEHVVFTLDQTYDISQMVVTVGTRYHYFAISGSYDGTSYTPIVEVNAENYEEYYAVNGNVYTFTAEELTAKYINYVKFVYTGNSNATLNLFGNFDEIAIYGTVSIGEPPAPEGTEPEDPANATIPVVGHTITGQWQQTNETDVVVGPQNAYDGDPNTKWTSFATGISFNNGEGIVLEFDWAYDLTKLEITVSLRNYYFNVYGSTDNKTYRKIASVTDDSYYTDYVCTLDNLNAENVKYLRILFTGNAENSAFTNLNEVAAYGTASEGGEKTAVTIQSHTLLGEAWSQEHLPTMSYDGQTGTIWNPAVGANDGTYGVVYTLDRMIALTDLVLTFGTRQHYFDVYGSRDNKSYKKLASVNAENADSYYDKLVCTISGMEAKGIRYIKLIFKGNAAAGNKWVGLYEVAVSGLLPVVEDSFTVSGVFSSNMVLQRDKEIPVWGWGKTGEIVEVEFAGVVKTATVDADGNWKVTFPAQSANAVGQSMTISCDSGDQVVFDNILIGDVYIVNGQSNAELAVYRTAAHLDNAGKEAVKELFRYDDNIRIYLQKKADVVSNPLLWTEPQKNVINPDWAWKVAAEDDAFWNFSAMGMYFAKNLRESLDADIPVGLIQMAAGGAQLYELASEEMNAQYGYDDYFAANASRYYNTMVNPFVGYPVVGMLYFQGESNSHALAETYARDLNAFFSDLRTRWGHDFYVYNVQLSSYGQQQVDQGIWPYLPVVRDQQYQLLGDLENYYLTVSMDVGYAGEVDQGTNVEDCMHPKDKKTLGERIAKQALAVYYDKLEVGENTFSPVPSEVQWTADGITISFDNAETLGLATGDKLVGFQCVINGEAVDVDAQIVNGNQVKLDVDATIVSEVYYGMFFLCYPEDANLVNGGNLPAPAFTIKNPGEFTSTKVEIVGSEISANGWLSNGTAATSPYYSYDGKEDTYWNPLISDFADEPSITYFLSMAADIENLTFSFMKRQEYFTLLVSTDGSTFVEAAKITADNYTEYLCTVDGLNLTDVTAIKLVFTGSSDNGKWVGLYEVGITLNTETEESTAVTVEKWNLTLGDDIGANFYIEVQESADNVQASITVAGNTSTYELSEMEQDSNGYYVISVHLAAAQMTETITLNLIADGVTVQTKEYSVYEYAQYILTDANNEFDDETKALVLEMLNYGDKAQAYFAYEADAMDAELIADAGVSEIDSTNVTAMSIDGSADDISFYGASLVFESKIAVRLYYTADTMDGLTVTVGDETVTPKQKENGLYYVEIAQINPHDLDEQVTVNITDANGNTLTVSYGPMNYIVRMAEKGGDNLKALMKALYNYYLKAEAYIVK